MSLKIVLERATDIQRYSDTGVPFAWRSTGQQIATFRTWESFEDYIHRQRRRLKTAVAFSGSASTLHQANTLLARKLKETGIL